MKIIRTGCPKNYTDLVDSSYVNLALIDGSSISKCSLIVNLNIATSFVGTGALIGDILFSQAEICIHQQAGAWPKKILEAQRINQRKS